MGAYAEPTGQRRVFSFDSVTNEVAYDSYSPSQYPTMFEYLGGMPGSNFSSDFDKRSVNNHESVDTIADLSIPLHFRELVLNMHAYVPTDPSLTNERRPFYIYKFS